MDSNEKYNYYERCFILETRIDEYIREIERMTYAKNVLCDEFELHRRYNELYKKIKHMQAATRSTDK